MPRPPCVTSRRRFLLIVEACSRRTRTRPAARATWATWAALAVALPALVTGCGRHPDTSATTGVSDASASASPSPRRRRRSRRSRQGPGLDHGVACRDLPQGCRDLLDDAVLAQLDGVPLNAPGMGGGIRPDSSRVCIWGEPGAAATLP